MAAKQPLAASSQVHALLTGPPGIGKTTLIRKVSAVLQERGIELCGFYTEEVRADRGASAGGRGQRSGRGGGARGPRIGFDVVTLAGQRSPLARVGSGAQRFPHERGKAVCHQVVGKYQVDVNSFEQIALPTLQIKAKSSTDHEVQAASGADVTKAKQFFVIDEIGKMELFSRDFIEAVKALFRCPSVVVLATIPIARQKSHWLVEELRHRPDCQLFEVSEKNRDNLVQEIMDFLLGSLSP